MRILHVLTRYLKGGSEGNIKRAVLWEVAQGHEPAVALGGIASDPHSLADLREHCPVYDVPELVPQMRPIQDALAFRRLVRIINYGRFDVVSTHQSKAGALGRTAAAGTGALIVHHVHMPSFGPGYRSSGSAVFWCAERYCTRRTDWVVFVGEELRSRYLRAGLARHERTYVVRSPIDVDRFAGVREWDVEQRMRMRMRLGLHPDSAILVGVGALEPRKRHNLLIRNLAPLLASNRAQLVIAGDGPLGPELRSQAAVLGVSDSIHLVGHVDEVEAILGVADVLVHSSRVEGVPQVAIQAMAAGVPIVATDVCGLREVPAADVTLVSSNGRGLADAVSRVLARPTERDPIPLEHLRHWRPEDSAEQLAALYHKMLGDRTGRPSYAI